jgi:pancreatic triacylglycerol lipase
VTARNRVPLVAGVLARLIDFLNDNQFTRTNEVIIAGHSLGAHIAGITGKRVTSGRINTIFGLDPGGPLFSINSPDDRFDSEDAMYTEGIRTNAGTFGFDLPLAHADFYPNW